MRSVAGDGDEGVCVVVVGGGEGEIATHPLFETGWSRVESTCGTNLKKCNLSAGECSPNLGDCHLLTLQDPLSSF